MPEAPSISPSPVADGVLQWRLVSNFLLFRKRDRSIRIISSTTMAMATIWA